MITVLFIVVANEAFQCVGTRWCDPFSAVELTRMWQLGLVEIMFESPGLLKVYRRTRDKFAELRQDRMDRMVNIDEQ